MDAPDSDREDTTTGQTDDTDAFGNSKQSQTQPQSSVPDGPREERRSVPGTDELAVSAPREHNGYTDNLDVQLSRLRTENASLSRDYARARKSSYRQVALWLIAIGVAAVLGGIALPRVQAALFSIGSIGLFGGVLTWYLTPERVVPIDVSESVYDATAATLTQIRDELGLQHQTVYVPADGRVRGFVPRYRTFELPENTSIPFVNVADASRGIMFTPTGQRLVDEFERIQTTQTSWDAATAVEQLGATLAAHFEIVDTVTVTTDSNSAQLTVSVENAAFGSVSRIDHPVVSTLACGVVRAVGDPVTVKAIDDATVVFTPRRDAV